MCLHSTKQQGSSKQANAFDSIRANLKNAVGGVIVRLQLTASGAGPARRGEKRDGIKKLYLRFMQTSRISLQHTATTGSPFLPSNINKTVFNPLLTGPSFWDI